MHDGRGPRTVQLRPSLPLPLRRGKGRSCAMGTRVPHLHPGLGALDLVQVVSHDAGRWRKSLYVTWLLRPMYGLGCDGREAAGGGSDVAGAAGLAHTHTHTEDVAAFPLSGVRAQRNGTPTSDGRGGPRAQNPATYAVLPAHCAWPPRMDHGMGDDGLCAFAA